MSDAAKTDGDEPSQLFIKCVECLGFFPDCPNCGGSDMRMIPMPPDAIERFFRATEAEQNEFYAAVFKWGIGSPVTMYGRCWEKRPTKPPERKWR